MTDVEWYEVRTPLAKLTVVAKNVAETRFFVEKARQILDLIEKQLDD